MVYRGTPILTSTLFYKTALPRLSVGKGNADMRTFLATLVLGVFLAACEHYSPSPPPLKQIESEVDAVIDNRQVVILAQTRDQLNVLMLKARPKGYVLVRREALPALGYHLGVLLTPYGVDAAFAIRELEAMVAGISVGVNHRYISPQRSSSAAAGRRYADAMISWPATGCETQRPIGIVDAAIDFSDPALSHVRGNARRFVDAPASTDHATALAVMAAGNNRLQNAELYNAIVFGQPFKDDSAAGVDSIVRAIDWLLSNKVHLVNLSLEGPYNRIFERSIQRASGLGVVFVAAAGNSGSQSAPRYPAAFNEVIAVTAVDSQKQLYASANRGPHIDFSAPGVDVFVSTAAGDRYVSGTSFAAVFVTGALAAEAAPGHFTYRSAFSALATKAKDLGPVGRDPMFGEGLIQSPSKCRSKE
jgi:hypothetical protein